MSFPKIILMGSLAVFAVIGATAVYKKMTARPDISLQESRIAEAKVPIIKEAPVQKPEAIVKTSSIQPSKKEKAQKEKHQAKTVSVNQAGQVSFTSNPLEINNDFPDLDRISQLFTTGPNKLPIVETIVYASRVPWLKGRPAWIADYASYYTTSRHFIARSLNGKLDYLTQKVISGSKFNVFRKDKRVNFHLLVDLSRCKLGFYYIDLDTNERVLLKSYRVGIGRLDPQKESGSLTPTGKYSLGEKVAIYRPGTMGYFQDQKVEMVQVFGTRWLPFEQELEGATSSARGYGIHGAPWTKNEKGELVENVDGISKYDSDGCIRLKQDDIEEIFSIVVTKPTFVEIVKDFHEAKLPGIEVAAPTR